MEIVLLIMLIGGLFASSIERREWNKGFCRENGLPWEYFDTDSQGGRGYVAGNIYCWQSWGHDK
jgi:hypothetical protein